MAYALYLSTCTLNKYVIYTLDIAEHSTEMVVELTLVNSTTAQWKSKAQTFSRSYNAFMCNKVGLHYINNLCDKW